MADFAQKLPKWQATANAIPNALAANAMPKKYFLSSIFFC
jgi:hypothetical protein